MYDLRLIQPNTRDIMTSANSLRPEVFSQIYQLLDNKSLTVTDDMPLIGGESVLDSMKLVELCLALEDRAAEIGFEFDWTSDAAMSRSRSMFRTAGALATEFISQMEAKK
jgi:acyl carrier protein